MDKTIETVDENTPNSIRSKMPNGGLLHGILGGGKTRKLSDKDELHMYKYNQENLVGSSICNASTWGIGHLQYQLGQLDYDVETAKRRSENGEVIDTANPVNAYTPPLPVFLKFLDVKFKVILKQQANWKIHGTIAKEILHGVTGSVAPGELLALMGPSGSGKTTVLNLLGGRVPQYNSCKFSGTITYNELPYNKNLKRRIGFVAQDDILYPHLTVRETFKYAALLRLPKSFTMGDKIKRAEEVIEQLGLERCKDTMIGGSFSRGISGGERKRVCIGLEILIDPSIMLLDEPTSGLDSTTALRIVLLLRKIVQERRTIVMTIHQPSSRLFYKFDKVILLSEGYSIYFGKGQDAMNYFESIGFRPLIAMNPADFLLDLCSGITDDMSIPGSLESNTEVMGKENVTQESPAANDVRQVWNCNLHLHNHPSG